MRKTVRIAIDEEVHKQAKAQAALEGVTLAAFIEAAISEKVVKSPAKRSAQKGKKA